MNIFQFNPEERYKAVRAMDFLARSVNNENHIDLWLSTGVADGDITEDTPDEALNDYIEDDSFADLMETFLCVMYRAYKDGGLYINGIVSP